MPNFIEFQCVDSLPYGAPEALKSSTASLLNTVVAALKLLREAEFPVKAVVLDISAIELHQCSFDAIRTAGYDVCDVSVSNFCVSICLVGEFGRLHYQVETAAIFAEGN